MSNPDFATLFEFLQYPLETTKPLIERFASLPGAITRGSGEQSFVYMPGARKDRVLLVAHADTVWDCDPNHSSTFPASRFVERDGALYSDNPEGKGLGADDRAGCALLWDFRDYGHSLLVVSGEEKGRIGSNFLMQSNPDIADEINGTHGFMIELDRRNAFDYKCYDVGSDHLRHYLAGSLQGFSEPDRHSHTDICTLCRDICGVNLSVGYRFEHSAKETLILEDWIHTCETLWHWIIPSGLPRFPMPRKLAPDAIQLVGECS